MCNPSLHKYLIFACVLALLAAAASLASAQNMTWLRDTIERQGWQCVSQIDSIDYNGLRPEVFGDTVIYRFKHTSLWDQMTLVSIDGGVTVSHGWRYPTPPNSSYYRSLQFRADPIEVRYAFEPYGIQSDSIYLTLDLGRTWVSRHIDTVEMGLPNYSKGRRGWLDPTDDGTIYLELGDSGKFDAGNCTSYYLRSQDTGKTWAPLNLPAPHGGYGTTRGMLMDMRQHGLWYTLVAAKWLEYPQWYRTEDNGEHLDCCVIGPSLDEEGELAGLRYPGEILSPWGRDVPIFRLRRGYESRNGYGMNDTILDWTDSLLPGRPDTLRADHGAFIGFSEPGPFFNFQIHPLNRDFLLLPLHEYWQDSEGYLHNKQFWFYSSNAAKTWTKIWEDTLYVNMVLDKRRVGTIWMTATPGIWGAYGSSTYAVFKKDVLAHGSITDTRPTNKVDCPQLILRQNSLEIIGNSKFEELRMYDILGRDRGRYPLTPQVSTSQTITYSFQTAAQYYGVFRSRKGSVCVIPVQLQR